MTRGFDRREAPRRVRLCRAVDRAADQAAGEPGGRHGAGRVVAVEAGVTGSRDRHVHAAPGGEPGDGPGPDGGDGLGDRRGRTDAGGDGAGPTADGERTGRVVVGERRVEVGRQAERGRVGDAVDGAEHAVHQPLAGVGEHPTDVVRVHDASADDLRVDRLQVGGALLAVPLTPSPRAGAASRPTGSGRAGRPSTSASSRSARRARRAASGRSGRRARPGRASSPPAARSPAPGPLVAGGLGKARRSIASTPSRRVTRGRSESAASRVWAVYTASASGSAPE